MQCECTTRFTCRYCCENAKPYTFNGAPITHAEAHAFHNLGVAERHAKLAQAALHALERARYYRTIGANFTARDLHVQARHYAKLARRVLSERIVATSPYLNKPTRSEEEALAARVSR